MISFLFSLILILVGHDIIGTFAFQSPPANQIIQCRHHHCGISTTAIQSAADSTNESEDSKDDNGKEDGVGFTALPAIGASSFWDRDENNSFANNNDAYKSSDLARPDDSKNMNKNRIIINNEHASIVSNKFKIQYTCKKCNTRNSHSVTRMAYRKGIVIAMCKGCHSNIYLLTILGGVIILAGLTLIMVNTILKCT